MMSIWLTLVHFVRNLILDPSITRFGDNSPLKPPLRLIVPEQVVSIDGFELGITADLFALSNSAYVLNRQVCVNELT
jgi:hypothetical protein